MSQSQTKQDDIDAMVEAAIDGNVEEVRKYLLAGVHTDDRRSDTYTALMDAAGNGHISVIQLLLQHNPNLNPNIQDKYGNTAAILAAYCCQDEALRLLVSIRDIDLSLKDNDGKTALDYAQERNKAGCVSILRDANR